MLKQWEFVQRDLPHFLLESNSPPSYRKKMDFPFFKDKTQLYTNTPTHAHTPFFILEITTILSPTSFRYYKGSYWFKSSFLFSFDIITNLYYYFCFSVLLLRHAYLRRRKKRQINYVNEVFMTNKNLIHSTMDKRNCRSGNGNVFLSDLFLTHTHTH